MYLQGDLGNLFDALFRIGVIDRVLTYGDWTDRINLVKKRQEEVKAAFIKVNAANAEIEKLIKILSETDSEIVDFLAMEVAKEFTGFEDYKKRVQ